ncbi:hypothetical protein ACFL6G_01735 [candidate division KSB1 bacterium]
MNEKSKKPLIIGLLLPVIMIIVTALSLLMQDSITPPEYNFIYVYGKDRYAVNDRFTVEDGRIVELEVEYPERYNFTGTGNLYVYDFAVNEGRLIKPEDADDLQIIDKTESPDGYEIFFGTMNEGIFPVLLTFRDRRKIYIKNESGSMKIDIFSEEEDRAYYFKFIGWLEK